MVFMAAVVATSGSITFTLPISEGREEEKPLDPPTLFFSLFLS